MYIIINYSTDTVQRVISNQKKFVQVPQPQFR